MLIESNMSVVQAQRVLDYKLKGSSCKKVKENNLASLPLLSGFLSKRKQPEKMGKTSQTAGL